MAKYVYIICFILTCFQLSAQDTTEVDYGSLLEELEADFDSMGIFLLIDSVLELENSIPNEINVRFGYNSNVQSAGRDFGIDQIGFNGAVSFFHKSGLYFDASGYWNSDSSPKYNLTVLSAGYLGNLTKRFSYAVTYDKWFYNFDDIELSHSYPTNSLGGGLYYNLLPINLGLDYNYFFGNENAHRLSPSITGYVKLPTFWRIKRITLLPYLSMIYGNDNVVIQFPGSLADEIRSNELLQENIRSEKFQSFLRTIELTPEEQRNIRIIESSNRLNQRQKDRLIAGIYFRNEEVQNYLYSLLETNEVEYGVMNYSMAMPVSVSTERWSFILSYSYNFPQKLPGELIELDPFGFVSFTISYRIPLR